MKQYHPLNGNSANTEDGRVNKYSGQPFVTIGNQTICVPKETVQKPITPSEDSRISDKAKLQTQVTQERVAYILNKMRTNYGSEGVRITRLQQQTLSCGVPTNRNPIVPIVCPPLPAPPAPPAPSCPLGKNQKY